MLFSGMCAPITVLMASTAYSASSTYLAHSAGQEPNLLHTARSSPSDGGQPFDERVMEVSNKGPYL